MYFNNDGRECVINNNLFKSIYVKPQAKVSDLKFQILDISCTAAELRDAAQKRREALAPVNRNSKPQNLPNSISFTDGGRKLNVVFKSENQNINQNITSRLQEKIQSRNRRPLVRTRSNIEPVRKPEPVSKSEPVKKLEPVKPTTSTSVPVHSRYLYTKQYKL